MNKRISSDLPPLALIAGPTASGKSQMALALAEQAGGVIVNADATQVYRDLRILSARPSAEDEARVEHLLYGHVDGSVAHDAASWAAAAKAAIADVHARGRLPILVGGTGLYIRTLLDGIAPIPPIDPAVRAAVRALPVAEAYRALGREDAAAAARLAATDSSRVARALEVIRSTGTPIATWREAREGGIGGSVRLAARILLPARDSLYARCDARFAAMLDAGAVAEVAALIRRGLDPRLPVMRAIGVRELAAWLGGEIGDAALREAGETATRRYAKRQTTWLRHQAAPAWPKLHEDVTPDDIIKLRNEVLTG